MLTVQFMILLIINAYNDAKIISYDNNIAINQMHEVMNI